VTSHMHVWKQGMFGWQPLLAKKGVNLVVHSEYCCKRTQLMKEFRPIVLLVVAIDLEVLFQSLVWSFSLVHRLRDGIQK